MDAIGRREGCPAVVLLLLWMSCAGFATGTQVDVQFTTLGIDVWPEYDRPGVLVIYRASLAPGVALPARVALRIPAAAGTPSAVAERQADGQLVNLPYERREEGDVAIIEMTATRPILQVEYYDPSINRDGTRRDFVFRWPGDYAVGDLTVSVQQPEGARGLTTEPAAASRAPGVDGLMYHTVGLGAVDAGESVAVSLSFDKDGDQLSIENMAPIEPPAAAASSPSSSTQGDNEVTLIVVVMVAIIAIVAIAVIVLRGRTGAASVGGAAMGTPGAKFCTQCGGAAGGADRFCHRCGAPLR